MKTLTAYSSQTTIIHPDGTTSTYANACDGYQLDEFRADMERCGYKLHQRSEGNRLNHLEVWRLYAPGRNDCYIQQAVTFA